MVIVGGSELIVIKLFAAMDNNTCSRLFLDCQGLWDFRGELCNCAMTLIFLGRSIHNCLRLRQKETEPLLQESRKSKFRINLLCSVFLLVLVTEISYSFGTFLQTYDFSSDELSHISRNASIGYKIVEIFCINCLNCLIIYVGEHYWSSVRTYILQATSRISEDGCCMTYFNKPKMKYLFLGMYAFAGVSFVTSAILLCYGHGDEQNADYTAENLMNFMVTMLSIVIFLIARFKLYQVIQLNQQISKKQLRKQFFYAFMVFLTCALRITTFWLAILDIDPSNTFRDFRPKDCFDESWGHALYIMGLTVMVNLLPAIIFMSIFKKTNSNNEFIDDGMSATLTEGEYSSQI